MCEIMVEERSRGKVQGNVVTILRKMSHRHRQHNVLQKSAELDDAGKSAQIMDEI